jgi:hypothetical protein
MSRRWQSGIVGAAAAAVGAISSAGERFVHTEEVTGSIPVSPTPLTCGNAEISARLHRRRPRFGVGPAPLDTAGREAAPFDPPGATICERTMSRADYSPSAMVISLMTVSSSTTRQST